MLSRLLCIGVLSLASALALSAEKAPGPNRADYLDKVAVLLDLNEGQKVQVQQLLDEHHQRMQAQMRSLREQAQNNGQNSGQSGGQSSGQRPDFEQLRAQRLQAEKELVDKLRPVLSDVQLQKFEVLRELTAPHQRGPRPQRRQGR